MREIEKIVSTIEKVTSDFESRLPNSEKRLLKEVIRLVQRLEVDNQGRVVANGKNLKLLQSIKSELPNAILNKEYLKRVKGILNGLDSIYTEQGKYFESLAGKPLNSAKDRFERYDIVRKMSMDSVVEGLTRTGIQANVTEKIGGVLLRSITSGGSYADLVEELSNFLTTNENGEGALRRYARTWVTTSVNEFAGQNNKLMTEDLGFEWYEYLGDNLETTREFCEHLTKKRYIHKSELADIIKGRIDGHQCEIYAKTGLPKGMKANTTVDNFQANRGGWNCGHQLSGVPTESVPKAVRDRLEVGSRKREAIKTERKEIKDFAKNNIVGKVVKHKDIDRPIRFSVKGFKEALNQPHKHLIEKNRIVKNIDKVLPSAKYVSSAKDTKNRPFKYHYLKIEIEGESSFISIRENLMTGDNLFWTITDELKK